MYFMFSTNTQRILAMGLSTCQEKKKKKEKICRQKMCQVASDFKLRLRRAQSHTVLLERR